MAGMTYKEAVFVGTLRSPDDTGGSTGRIKAGMWAVTLVSIPELAMDLGSKLWTTTKVRKRIMMFLPPRFVLPGIQTWHKARDANRREKPKRIYIL